MKSEYYDLSLSPNKSPDVAALDDSTFCGRESGMMYNTDPPRMPAIPGYYNMPASSSMDPTNQMVPPPYHDTYNPTAHGQMEYYIPPQTAQQQPQKYQMQPQIPLPPKIQTQNHSYPPSTSGSTTTPSPVSMISTSTNLRSLVTTVSGKVRSRPCDGCRKRKARCITEPNATQCNKCIARNIPCTFLDAVQPKKRRVDSGEPETNTSMSTSMPPSSAPQSSRDASSSTSGQTLTAPSSATPPIKDVQPVSDYSALPGKSLLKKTLSLQYPKSSFYVGHTSVHDIRFFDTATLDGVGQCVLNKDTAMRRVAPDVLFTIRNDFADDLHSEFIANSDKVERIVAPHGLALIDLYFRIVHPAFPILHKRIFMEKYARTHREFSPPLLAAVYILALKWWNYEPQLASQPKPDVEKLRRIALNTFSDFYEQPKLSVVQAGLLILQCSMERARSWILLSHVISLAEELGLGMDCQSWRLPRWERALRRRLAWAVYIEDKWVALIEGRPSHIDERRQWQVRKISAEDFPERPQADDSDIEGSLETENGRLLFMEMVKLSEIVSEILDTFFTLVAKSTPMDTATILTKAKPIQIKLREWHRDLPECLRMRNTKPRRLNSNGYLHLAYFAAEITLHRRIIRSLCDTSPAQIVSVCREAARTRLLAAIELVDTLKHEHIQAFWHSSAATNFALIGSFAALLYVTSRDDQEKFFYREQLLNYRWILRVGCKGFDEMGLALKKLEEAISQVPGFNDPPKEGQSYNDEDYSDENEIGDGQADIKIEQDAKGESPVTNLTLGGLGAMGNDHLHDSHTTSSDYTFDPTDVDLEKMASEMSQQ